MDKIVKLSNGSLVKVIVSDDPTYGISESDAEMDRRAQEAVKAAINRAIICKKPLATYDGVNKRDCVETPDGERKYV